jgi:hypothetical protein
MRHKFEYQMRHQFCLMLVPMVDIWKFEVPWTPLMHLMMSG